MIWDTTSKFNHLSLPKIAYTFSAGILETFFSLALITITSTLFLFIFYSIVSFKQCSESFSASSKLIFYIYHFIYLVVFLIQYWLNPLICCSNALRLIFNHCPRWICLVNCWTILIYSCYQKCHSIRTRHWLFLWWWISFSKVQSHIWDCLSQSFDGNWL